MFLHVEMSPSYLLLTRNLLHNLVYELKMKNDLRPMVALICTSVGVMWDRGLQSIEGPITDNQRRDRMIPGGDW